MRDIHPVPPSPSPPFCCGYFCSPFFLLPWPQLTETHQQFSVHKNKLYYSIYIYLYSYIEYFHVLKSCCPLFVKQLWATTVAFTAVTHDSCSSQRQSSCPFLFLSLSPLYSVVECDGGLLLLSWFCFFLFFFQIRMSNRRLLHWVFKVGNRRESIDFYKNILGNDDSCLAELELPFYLEPLRSFGRYCGWMIKC